MKIFTTINPRGNFENQNNALSSWRGYDIYSVNTKEEISLIKDVYPYINFIETDNVYNGSKKLIKLNAILDAIQNNCNDELCCIINSDIILKDKISLSKINKYAKDGIIIGTRWEIDNDRRYPFNNGYDIFIFNKKYTNLFKNNNYVIGMPWWDYWIPTISIKAGIRVYHIKNEMINHITHDTNYNDDDYIKFGSYLYKDIMIGLLKNEMNIRVDQFAIGIKEFIEKKQINIKI